MDEKHTGQARMFARKGIQECLPGSIREHISASVLINDDELVAIMITKLVEAFRATWTN